MDAICRSCGSEQLETVLSLGRLPLANRLLTEEQLCEPEPRYPLDLAFCPDCSLVQITETVPPEVLFRDYPYLSSFSELDNARDCVEGVLASGNLHSGSLVMEIGSNDGYLLGQYAERGIPVLGIDPAENIVPVAEERGVPTRCEFFGAAMGERLRDEGILADVIHANNVLAHVADLGGVVDGLRNVLKPDGQIVIQVPYVEELIRRTEFDTIYHEHLCYFSVTALYKLFARHGLEFHHVSFLPIHGGSIRAFVRHRKSGDNAPTQQIARVLEREQAIGMNGIAFYASFRVRVERLREALRSLLGIRKEAGEHLVGYAASAKGTTLLNYCGIGAETLDYVVDRSTVKQGRYTPGTHLRIEPPEKLLADMPNYALLLAWNHATQILRREAEYRARGGRFIVPVPEPRIYGVE
jgi:SAM-dependent methyltransferase